jgi:L-rhamnose mutarotase
VAARVLTRRGARGLALQVLRLTLQGGGRNDDVAVIRKAFRMSVHAGEAVEYERRHNPIWRELQDTLIRHGVRTYSIYLDPHTNDLFAYVELNSEAQWAAVAHTDVCRRWWRFMSEVMPANPDDSPISRELREVFHIESE